MSVILWGASDYGNLNAYLEPGTSGWGQGCRKRNAERLAVVSIANVEEFRETYGKRHGEPEPVTEEEILEATPHHVNPGRARSMLKLLAYNAHGSKGGRLATLEALVSVLTAALQVTP